MPEPSVAVRSSAVGEDSSTASFTGQHDTYLNVKGVEAVTQAVVGCWQSVSSSRVEEYRRQQGLSQDPPRIAVLVQRLVSADLSAVVFSANPVTGNPNEVVINANWGLGETVVGGTVTPDTYVISKGNFTVTSQGHCPEGEDDGAGPRRDPGGAQEADVPLALQNTERLRTRAKCLRWRGWQLSWSALWAGRSMWGALTRMGAFTCFNAGPSPRLEPASAQVTFTNSWADAV